MHRETRTWHQLTPTERDTTVAQYYGLGSSEAGAWERPVLDIIRDLGLEARDSGFTLFLPALEAESPCEVCGQPVTLQPISRTELRAALRDSADGSLPPTILRHVFPGQERPIFYRRDRQAPCGHCSHRPNQMDLCRCFRCKGERKAASLRQQERFRATAERETRERAHALIRARLDQRLAWHNQADIAREQFRVQLDPQLTEQARVLIQHAGRIEADGGLWLTVGPCVLLPAEQQLFFVPEPFDPWTVLAHGAETPIG